MIVTLSEDFTDNFQLDSELVSIPDSGLYLNSGVHPYITVKNLLSYLPDKDMNFSSWDNSATYGKYESTRKKSDIVKYRNKIYQSISSPNTNQNPSTETSYWLETDINSLRIKNYIFSVYDRVKSDLRLTRRLVDSENIYNYDDSILTDTTIPNDYAAFVIEPKGSDYVSFVLNSVSFRANTTSPQNLYVVHNGALVDTLSVTPNNGFTNFTSLNYSFSGPGRWIFAVDSQSVKSGGYIDSLKYDGFVVYTANGTGASAQAATWSDQMESNGLELNLTAYLDSGDYVTNNLVHFAQFIRAAFEWMTLEMFLNNANHRSNREQRSIFDRDLLISETKAMDGNTSAKRYENEKKRARSAVETTYDKELGKETKFKIKKKSI